MMGPSKPRKLRLFSPLLIPLFHEHSYSVFGILLYAMSESYGTVFAGHVVYKPWVLSVSSQALMTIIANLIAAADCLLLLHQLVIGVMVPKCTHYIKRITLNVSQTGCTVVSQLGFELGSLIRRAGSLPTKQSRPATTIQMLLYSISWYYPHQFLNIYHFL